MVRTVDIFAWTWNIWGAAHSLHQNSKNGDFCEEILMENDFEASLTTFCGYDHGNKASHTVQKIAVGR